MDNILITILAATEARFVDVDFFRGWATNLARQLSAPALWLLDIAACTSLESLADIIVSELRTRCVDVSETLPKLVIGFSFNKYRRGELSIQELASAIIDIADAYAVAGFDIDKFTITPGDLDTYTPLNALLEDLSHRSEEEFNRMASLPAIMNIELSS